MKSLRNVAWALLCLAGAAGSQEHRGEHAEHGQGGHGLEEHAGHPMPETSTLGLESVETLDLLAIPDTPLVDHTGRGVRFRSDLVEGHVVAINFIFTTCTTICPVQGALFADLQREMAPLDQQPGPPIRYLSISIDPAVDTPERLVAWASRFGDAPDWTLLTGDKSEVDHLLKGLGVFSALKEDHAPILLLGNATTDTWRRASAFAPPDQLMPVIADLRGMGSLRERQTGDEVSRRYFTDLPVVDQTGREHRFYSDLIAGRTVVLNSFFADCAGSCPVMNATVTEIQRMLGDRLGRDVFLLSISVDPGTRHAGAPCYLRQAFRRP